MRNLLTKRPVKLSNFQAMKTALISSGKIDTWYYYLAEDSVDALIRVDDNLTVLNRNGKKLGIAKKGWGFLKDLFQSGTLIYAECDQAGTRMRLIDIAYCANEPLFAERYEARIARLRIMVPSPIEREGKSFSVVSLLPFSQYTPDQGSAVLTDMLGNDAWSEDYKEETFDRILL